MEIVRGKRIGTLITNTGTTEMMESMDELADQGTPAHRPFTVVYLTLLCCTTARRGNHSLLRLNSEQVWCSASVLLL